MSKLYKVPYEYEQIDAVNLDYLLKTLAVTNTVTIYGAGHHGKLIFEHLEHRGIHVECFCDRDNSKQKAGYYGKSVISPEMLYKKRTGKKIIVSVYKHQMDIRRTLVFNGIPESDIIVPDFKLVKGYIAVPEDAMPDEFVDKYELHNNNQLHKMSHISKSEPPILVYTSVYNVRESYLRRAIESVLKQTFADFRYLIIDNGSTDGSEEIIKEYAEKDERIEVYTLAKNLQLSKLIDMKYYQRELSVRQRIMNEKSDIHKYFCVLDSDDYYMPHFLETTYELAEMHKADIIAGRTIMYAEDNPDVQHLSSAPIQTTTYIGKKQIADAFLDHTFIWRVVWGKLIRLRLYMNARHSSGDYERNIDAVGDASDVLNNLLRLDLSDIVVFTDKILHQHTIRSESKSRTMRMDSKAVTRMYYLFEWLKDFVERSGVASEKNLGQIKDFVFECLFELDLRIIANIKNTNPELTFEVINFVLKDKMPIELRRDERAEIMLSILNESRTEIEKKHLSFAKSNN